VKSESCTVCAEGGNLRASDRYRTSPDVCRVRKPGYYTDDRRDSRRVRSLRQAYAGFFVEFCDQRFVEFCDKRFAKFRAKACANSQDRNSPDTKSSEGSPR